MSATISFCRTFSHIYAVLYPPLGLTGFPAPCPSGRPWLNGIKNVLPEFNLVVKYTSFLSIVKWARHRPNFKSVSFGFRSSLYCFWPSYLAVWSVHGFLNSNVNNGRPFTYNTISISKPGLLTEKVCWRVTENWFWIYFSFDNWLSAGDGFG